MSCERQLSEGHLLVPGDVINHRRSHYPRETMPPFLPEGSWLILSNQGGKSWLRSKAERSPCFATLMWGCLSIHGEQMGTLAFVSTYPTCQLSSRTKAGVTQLRWPRLVCGRSETACVAQLLAWLPQRGFLMWLLSGGAGNCLS